jgi:UDPglucose 6-dehydrogenase
VKIAVLGCSFHLGPSYAGCLAELGHTVVGHDVDPENVRRMSSAHQPPLPEPGLGDLFRAHSASNRLSFTDSYAQACRNAEVVLVAWDTPVDNLDRADPESVLRDAASCFPYLRDKTIVCVISQLPVGSIRRMEAAYAALGRKETVHFASAPENLRLGTALQSFKDTYESGGFVLGVRSDHARSVLSELFGHRSLFMKPESAEMTKHARNAFLASQVTLTNEIACLSDEVGAVAHEVERGLRTEPRIGPKAFVRAGEPVAGGTLLRDIGYIQQLAAHHGVTSVVTTAIRAANEYHKGWVVRTLLRALLDYDSLDRRVIVLLGGSYKPGVNTSRRSYAAELFDSLSSLGATVRMYAPDVAQEGQGDLLSTCANADALVVCAPLAELRSASLQALRAATSTETLVVVDPGGFCKTNLADSSVAGTAYCQAGERHAG